MPNVRSTRCKHFVTSYCQIQSEQRETEKQKVDLEKALDRYREDLDREARYRHVMEDKWRTMAEDYEKKVKCDVCV